MIILSNPIAVTNEIDTIHTLFEEGMRLFHIRKPNFGETEMKQFISGINQNYRDRLALHSHYHLADKFNIPHIHFNEHKRKVIQMLPSKLPFDSYTKNGLHLSTSVHTIEDFNDLDKVFEYAFLSPVFPSISKADYYSKTDLFEAIKNRTNFNTKLIALGGIESKNIAQTLNKGFDDVALLGTIWNTNQAIKNFKLCQKTVHSL